MTALHLSSGEQHGLAESAEYVSVVKDAYREIGEGAPAEPRTKLQRSNPDGHLTAYVAILPAMGVMGGYTYSGGFSASNAWFMTPVFDADSGEPLAVLDGAYMNPYKTGAVGAVGTDALARDDATTLGVIGTGKQARGQLKAHATVRDFTQINVYSPTKANRESFAADFDKQLDADVQAVSKSTDAVTPADVVVTATKATDPVFDGTDLSPGTHVTAIGQYTPGHRELDAETIKQSVYVPDLRKRAFQDAGSFLHALDAGIVSEDHIHAELGEIVAGVTIGRESPSDITVFDSGGTAIETVSSGYMLYEKAIEAGLGTEIEFTPASDAMPDSWR